MLNDTTIADNSMENTELMRMLCIFLLRELWKYWRSLRYYQLDLLTIACWKCVIVWLADFLNNLSLHMWKLGCCYIKGTVRRIHHGMPLTGFSIRSLGDTCVPMSFAMFYCWLRRSSNILMINAGLKSLNGILFAEPSPLTCIRVQAFLPLYRQELPIVVLVYV